MSYTLHEKLKGLTPYEPVAGTFSVRLDANESYLNFPDWLRMELYEIISTFDFNRYPDVTAKTVRERYASFYGIDPDLLTAGNGSDELIMLIVSALLGKGERVMVIAPDFSMYGFYSRICENPVLVLPKGEDLTIDVDEVIHKAKEEKVRAVFFSNPCNPTGQGLKREDVRRLIRSVEALVVLDEAYMDFWDQSLLSEVCDYDNLIILRTCSKAFGMAALRLGFAVANPTITNALRAVKSPYNVNALTQEIAAAVLKYPDYIRECIRQILQSRDQLEEKLTGLFAGKPDAQVYPTCTNFVLIKTPLSRSLFESLGEKGVAIRELNGCLRISAGSEAENEAVLTALSESLKEGEKIG